jgi:hypothetical protein
MSRIQPTDVQRRAAFELVRGAEWPLDYEQAIADPVRERLVQLYAVRLALGEQVTPALAPVVHRTPVLPPEAPPLLDPDIPRRAWRPRRTPPLFDRKRAAAGEREDD